MADYDEDNDYEEEFQEADEPEDFNDDLEAGDDQEQIDVLPAGEFITFSFCWLEVSFLYNIFGDYKTFCDLVTVLITILSDLV